MKKTGSMPGAGPNGVNLRHFLILILDLDLDLILILSLRAQKGQDQE